MIAHQDDAIQLARMEAGDGVNRKARDLADRIDQSRTGQIKLMLNCCGRPDQPRDAVRSTDRDL